MSNINVAIRMRPISENKSKKEVQWIVPNNNTIRSVNTSNPYNFNFEHIFSASKSNYDIYSSIVNPVVKSCLNGYNGTVIMYGQTSSGKHYSMMGNDEGPGIQLLAIEQLFEREDMSSDMEFKIRVGYIEIYREEISDLLDPSKRVKVDDLNGRFETTEVAVNNYEETNKLLLQGTKQRRQSITNKNKLSSKSHAIFRLTIESKDKANGAVQTSYLKFVYVTGSDLVSGTRSLDSQLKNENDSNISLLWLNVVVNELSERKADINFGKSNLTQLIQESLTRDSTAIICNIRKDVVDETISTLKFATRAKKVQTIPVPNAICELKVKDEFSNFEIERKRKWEMEIDADRPCKRVRTWSTSTEPKCESIFDNSTESFENQLKEIADVKVKNSLLIKELAEVKAARESDKKWFEEKMIAATLAEGKLELLREEKNDTINELQQEIEELIAQVKTNGNTINEFQQQIENYETSKKDLLAQVEALRKINQVRNDWINFLQEENSQLNNKPKVLSANAENSTAMQKKIDHLLDDVQMLKDIVQSNKLESEPSIGYIESEDEDAPASPYILIEADCYIGCIMGINGKMKKTIENATGAKINFSDDRDRNNPYAPRTITVTGTKVAVGRAKDVIIQKIENQKMEQRRQSGFY